MSGQPETTPRNELRLLDPVTAVREHPGWYFRRGVFDVAELVELLAGEAIAHGSTDLYVRRWSDWWVLASWHDWLARNVTVFDAPTPDPGRGRNATRHEVLLTAFCPNVLTSADGDVTRITGDQDPPQPITVMLERNLHGRVIAFQPTERNHR